MSDPTKRIATLAAHMQPARTDKADDNAAAAGLPAPQNTLSATDVFHGMFSSPPNVARHGGDLVADVLESHGVNFIFTLVGGHISPLLVSSKNRGIRIIDVRHEVNAVFAADAVGRLTGRPGVAAVTAGPGVTNTVTAVKNAMMAQSPLVLLGGAAATILQGRGSLHLLFEEASRQSRREYVESLSDNQPVFLEPKVNKNGFLADKVVRFSLGRLWGAAFGHDSVAPLPVHVPRASASEVNTVAQLLRGAKRPVLVCGSGSMLCTPQQAHELQAAINVIGIPTFLGGMSRGLLGRNSPLHIRQGRGLALKQADLIILAGAVCDFRLDYGRALPKSAKVVAVNRSTDMLALNADIFWSPHFKSATDPAYFLVELSKVCGVGAQNATWAAQLKAGEAKKEAANAATAKLPALGRGAQEGVPLVNPLALCEAVESVLPDNSILVADGGDFVATASYILRPRGPLSWLDPGAFGTLGVGAGFALGAKLVNPDAEVWIVWGDGSAGYSIAEFDTFARHGVPVIGLVGNDACWTQIEREQTPMFDSDVACPLEYCSYDTVAQGYGGEGFTVAAASAAQDTRALLQNAQAAARKGTPMLVNVRVGKTSFREGSLSV